MTRALPRLRPDAALRLFCLPYAGGSARIFHDWTHHVPRELEIVPLEMRGRGVRFGEPPADRLDPIVAEAIAVILDAADRPFALFGHSMGALAAFETACALGSRTAPARLFLSAHRAPDVVSAAPPVHALPDADLLAHLRRLDTASVALGDEDLMRVMLPVVRADLTACETFRYRPRPPLTCGITVFGGSDDPLVPTEHLRAWRAHTQGDFRLEVFPGGHFFINACLPAALASLVADLRQSGALGGNR